MDLITQLPPTADGNTAIIVFCDKFTKMIHVVPTKTKCDGPEVAHIFLKHVFQYHGMPDKLTKSVQHYKGRGETNSCNYCVTRERTGSELRSQAYIH